MTDDRCCKSMDGDSNVVSTTTANAELAKVTKLNASIIWQCVEDEQQAKKSSVNAAFEDAGVRSKRQKRDTTCMK